MHEGDSETKTSGLQGLPLLGLAALLGFLFAFLPASARAMTLAEAAATHFASLKWSQLGGIGLLAAIALYFGWTGSGDLFDPDGDGDGCGGDGGGGD